MTIELPLPVPINSKYLLKVAIPSPLRRLFDYCLPSSISPDLVEPGMRVKVPFANRELIGIVIETDAQSDIPEEKLKDILELIDNEPAIDPKTLTLYQWASTYYQFPIGQALQTSLPKFVREGRPLELAPDLRWRLSALGNTVEPNALKRAAQQQKLFDLIKNYQHLSTEEASVLLGSSASPFLKALNEKGLIESYSEHKADIKPTVSSFVNSIQVPELNPEQAEALNALSLKLGFFSCSLLEGITGSGKTEVYLQLIAKVLNKQQQVLVLVPEISLTPQTLQRFKKRFNNKVVALHSGLNDTERFTAWLDARNHNADIIIGTRSAIFTPIPSLGLIIVDEEHDASYKQHEGFRYSARDLGVYRAQKLNIPILLGSATPSLESLRHAQSSQYTLLALNERAGEALPPQFKFLDLKGQDLEEGFSLPLLEAIKDHISQGKQALIFINRRGYAPLLQCQSCGWTATCPRCETGYTLHQNPPNLRCHHCESQIRLMQICPHCNHSDLAAIGLGTERSEKVLNSHFPDTPVLRIDRDTTSKKEAMGKMIDIVDSGKPCILIGTQMLAKGHHFPGVTLVAILDADSGLFSADFRGQEHMGQLITQVAGRAGRGTALGEVLIQTYHSDHPALNALVQDGYGKFARNLLNERQNAKLPPYTFQILFKAEANNPRLPEQFLANAKQLALQLQTSNINMIGPMPAPMEKRAGRFRIQLLLQSPQRSELHILSRRLIFALEQLPESRKVRWSVDIDPIDFS